MPNGYDCSGWATRNDIQCSDGRFIRRNAFKDQDGTTVPLVWMHQHSNPENVLGHALLENRDEGVYAYCYFNESEAGQTAKTLVNHGDVEAFSINANRLTENGHDVLHGIIREVSLVLAGANPGALIENVISHGEELSDEAIIFNDGGIELNHADDKNDKKNKEEKPVDNTEEKKTVDKDEETVKDVFNTLNEKQKKVVYALIGQAISDEEDGKTDDKEEKEMKHNVFETDEKKEEGTLTHAEMTDIITTARNTTGSLKEAAISHGAGDVTYGIRDIDYLFPEAKNLNTQPEFIKRDTEWVDDVMSNVHHSPFARIKSMFANITADEARAKGYVKGRRKIEEVFGLLKRTTTPQTVYKKQKLDRDDIIDITDFDVVAWIKSEMRMMLDEELARAYLIGDGRPSTSEDKIDETHIRPIWTDDDLFTIKAPITLEPGDGDKERAKKFIRTAIKARKNYKGSGNLTLYTYEDVITDCLLLEDRNERVIYDTMEKLATALRVKKIVTVPVMEGQTRVKNGYQYTLMGLFVNLKDYTVGADKGGSVSLFDDFDINYNQMIYLIETRCSGALTKPYSAIAVEIKETAPNDEDDTEPQG